MSPKPVKKMYVIKRGGRQEQVHFDKITSRIQKLCYGLNIDFVDPVAITLKVINGVYPGVTTAELDTLAAETAASMIMDHPDYGILAARIAISNLHKDTKKHFSDVINDLYHAINSRTKKPMRMISEKNYNIIMNNADRLNSCIIYDRDFSYSYFGFKLLEQSYLLKINGKTVERPQHLLMRVAVGIHEDDVDAAIETYNLMSEQLFIHASSTLFNAAKVNGQLASSFIVMMPDDSIEGICKCLSQCAIISKNGGGVGVNLQNIRSKGTYIAGTNGVSNGLVPMLRVFNHSARYVDQGGYKRPGSLTVYLEPWHADVLDVLELKKSTGKEEMRAKDLFYALWIPDLFMKRVESNQMWSLMCPHQCQGLPQTYGDEFEQLYEKYENEGRYVRQVPAQDLWRAIIASQLETGMPFTLYKDSCNKKSNQKHLGAIRGGGLSAEVIQYSSPDEVAACNLASIAVNMFVSADKSSFDFVKLKDVVKVVTKNLDKIIDVTFYPMEEARTASTKHRPIGIGVQGLADTFILMRIPFDSKEAALLNKQIFETLYYGALESSSELAEKWGKYASYDGSPVCHGILQYELWNVTPTTLWDWEALKKKIQQHGLRNSLLLASMPTGSTSRILANSENVSPYTSYVYTQKVSSGEFQVVNNHLLRDLTERGLWDEELKDLILNSNGSIQHIPSIPDDLKALYKTAWEISQKHVIDMAADRGAYIDQSQSLNIHIENPTYASMSSMHFYGWKKGLKTGMYYLRTKSTSNPSRIAAEINKLAIKNDTPAKNGEENGKVRHVDSQNDIDDSNNMESLVCSLNNPDGCEMCGA